jgi:hypothetical protein
VGAVADEVNGGQGAGEGRHSVGLGEDAASRHAQDLKDHAGEGGRVVVARDQPSGAAQGRELASDDLSLGVAGAGGQVADKEEPCQRVIRVEVGGVSVCPGAVDISDDRELHLRSKEEVVRSGGVVEHIHEPTREGAADDLSLERARCATQPDATRTRHKNEESLMIHLHARLTLLLALSLSAAAALTPDDAQAFCGFYVSGANEGLYNDATQVVLLRDGARTVLSMQNTYEGPPENFALVVPVPVVLQRENVRTLPREVFERVDRLSAPRLVEYWEQDPCAQEEGGSGHRGTVNPASGGGGGPGHNASLGVAVEARFAVGEYDVVVLSANDSTGLDTWLRAEKYNIPEGAEPMLKPYIESGMFFFVAKVNLKKVKRENGRAVLSPLRFHYDTDTFQLPVRLGLLNARGPQDLIIHILAQSQRYEAANLPNATIPTNIEVKDAVKGKFPEFYAALFDATLTKNPKAVVTEYSWDAGTCDPCPGPTLQGADFLTLGADVLPDKPQWGFVLTRLHARYTAADLKDDIVFQAAAPIFGGREHAVSAGGLEKGATPGGVNNFQGRYIVRHPWLGEIACENPVRGQWGGPSGSKTPSTSAAQDVAFAPRGGLKLTESIAEDISELGIKAE